MKNIFNYFSPFIISFILILLLCNSTFAQLNGNYTINPIAAASGTNYQNWASAVGDLVSGNRTDGGTPQGAGVSGPVTITVYDTIYNSSVEIAAISGTSYTNKITFKSKGGDSTKCLIRVSSTATSTNDFVLFFNGADYVTFQEIGMERTGTNTYSTVVQIANDADNNRLLRCLLKGRKVPSSSGRGFTYGISSMIYFKGNGDSTEITQNRLIYGYNGIYDTIACTGNTISNNIIDTSGSSGIYMTVQSSLRILGNTFNMGDFGAGKGHYTSYGFRIETSPSLIAANNKVFMSATNGQVVRAIVMASVTSTSTAPAMVYNNWIVNQGGTTECTGFAVYGCSYLNLYYNNILILNSLTNASAYYHYAAFTNNNIRLVNNNLVNKGGGYAINVPGTNTADLDSVNYNNYYTNGKYLTNWGGTNYSTFSSYQSGSSKDGNGLNVDPGYSGNFNLHVSNVSLNGKALYDSRIRTDNDGESRDNATPDIGADEFFPVTLDAGIANLDSPLLFCPGNQIIKASFQNYGFDTIKSVEIQWQINGTTQTPYSWTGKVAPGASSASIPLGTYTFSSNTSYNFKIWTRIPNGNSDGKTVNDTLKITRLPAMSGTYTIGDTSIANYKSFNQSITAMTSRGVCGAITFNVYNGTYNEQLTLVKLPGMGSSSPILFQSISKDSTKVNLTLPSTTATGSNNATLQLRGAEYITFKGITFERTGTNPFAHVIHILNGSNHNTFTHCRMLGLQMTSANANAINIWSDQGQDDYNEFKNNHVKYGYYSMLYGGTTTTHETGNIIEGNIFESSFNSSVLLSFNDSILVKGNTFLNVNLHTISNYDLQLLDCDKGIRVIGNFFKATNTDSALFISACNASSSSYGIVANNSIVRNYGKGIILNGVDYQNVVFNSIYFPTTSADNIAISTTATASTYIVLKNNNIVMNGGHAFYIIANTQVSASDNNNLYIKGTQFAYWGTSITNLSNLITTTATNGKSLSIDPLFISANLHIKNYLLKGKGQPISGVATDFDGETRNSTNPDIGADEFKLSPNDAGIIAVIKPAAGTCASKLDVSVVIKNFGNDTLKSAVITWSVNGNVQTPYNWSKKLITNATDTVIIGSYDFSSSFNPRFIVKANLPNGQSDGIQFNDSIIINRALRALPTANAGTDMNICQGDSLVLGSGPGTGLSYKWMTISNTVIGTNSEITVKPTSKTKYILEVTNIAFGCNQRDTVEIGTTTRPAADAGKDKTICPGNTVQIGTTSQSGFSYTWSSKPAGFTSTSANPTDVPAQTTTYILEKSVTGSGCNDLDTVLVTVASLPIPKISGLDVMCNGIVLNYNTASINGSNYKWKITGGIINTGQNTNSVNVKWNVAGIGILKVIETNSAGCKDSTSFYVTVNQNPKADFSISGTCLTSISKFNNLSINAQTYAWTFGDGTTSIANDPAHTYPEAISYNVRLIAKNSLGCNDTMTKLLPIDPLPIASFTYVAKSGNTIDFKNTSTVSSGTINSWNWKFGDGDTAILENPSHKYSNSSNSFVTLCVKSLAGCENCISKEVGFAKINSVSNYIGLKVYPNPSSGNFTINSTKQMKSIEVINTLGQVIKTFDLLPDNELKLNITEQSSGIYFIKIDCGNQYQVVRITKK